VFLRELPQIYLEEFKMTKKFRVDDCRAKVGTREFPNSKD